MERRALDVLGEAVFLGDALLADDARDRGGLRQSPLLDQQFERPESATAGRNLVHAGLDAIGVAHLANGKALEERAPGDVLGELFDRDAGLDPADVRLAQHQLVEGNVPRRAQDDLLHIVGFRGHGRSP